MSELISDKEALIALAHGEDVEFKNPFQNIWVDIGSLTVNEIGGGYYYCSDDNEKIDTSFRIKPKTITINSIEVPAPFEPKAGEQAFYITSFGNYDALVFDWQLNDFGYWRTEAEIKQVVSALRSIFKGE